MTGENKWLKNTLCDRSHALSPTTLKSRAQFPSRQKTTTVSTIQILVQIESRHSSPGVSVVVGLLQSRTLDLVIYRYIRYIDTKEIKDEIIPSIH